MSAIIAMKEAAVTGGKGYLSIFKVREMNPEAFVEKLSFLEVLASSK